MHPCPMVVLPACSTWGPKHAVRAVGPTSKTIRTWMAHKTSVKIRTTNWTDQVPCRGLAPSRASWWEMVEPTRSTISSKVQTANPSEAFKTSRTSTLSLMRCLGSLLLLSQRNCLLRKGSKLYLQGSTNCTTIKLVLKRLNSLTRMAMVVLWQQHYPWACPQEIFQCRIARDRRAKPTCLKCMRIRWLAIATSWTTTTVTQLPSSIKIKIKSD